MCFYMFVYKPLRNAFLQKNFPCKYIYKFMELFFFHVVILRVELCYLTFCTSTHQKVIIHTTYLKNYTLYMQFLEKIAAVSGFIFIRTKQQASAIRHVIIPSVIADTASSFVNKNLG